MRCSTPFSTSLESSTPAEFADSSWLDDAAAHIGLLDRPATDPLHEPLAWEDEDEDEDDDEDFLDDDEDLDLDDEDDEDFFEDDDDVDDEDDDILDDE